MWPRFASLSGLERLHRVAEAYGQLPHTLLDEEFDDLSAFRFNEAVLIAGKSAEARVAREAHEAAKADAEIEAPVTQGGGLPYIGPSGGVRQQPGRVISGPHRNGPELPTVDIGSGELTSGVVPFIGKR